MKVKNISVEFHVKLANSRFYKTRKRNAYKFIKGLESSRLLGYCYDDIELVEEEEFANSINKCNENLSDLFDYRIKSRLL